MLMWYMTNKFYDFRGLTDEEKYKKRDELRGSTDFIGATAFDGAWIILDKVPKPRTVCEHPRKNFVKIPVPPDLDGGLGWKCPVCNAVEGPYYNFFPPNYD